MLDHDEMPKRFVIREIAMLADTGESGNLLERSAMTDHGKPFLIGRTIMILAGCWAFHINGASRAN
jgi:hypothetical protein